MTYRPSPAPARSAYSRIVATVKTLFEPAGFVPARDGTEIDPFLNPMADPAGVVLPGILSRVSAAAGRLRPGVTSAIHMHPVVAQITYVVSGSLTVTTVERGQSGPHAFEVEAGSAVVTEAGVPVQFSNSTQADVRLLYIVMPGYVSDDAYDDAVLLEDWTSTLSDADLALARESRAAALRRRQKTQGAESIG